MAYGLKLPWDPAFLGKKVPDRGDVVVFSYSNQPDTSYVKRVIGLPGDKIQISGGKLLINEAPLDYVLESPGNSDDNPNPESFDIYLESDLGAHRRVIFQKNREDQNFGPLVVPPGEIFLLGDNRDASDDSRYWGTVPIGQVYGKVLFVWLSLDWQKRWGGDRYPSIRWERVFFGVH
jgi:signal peptidase I